MIHILFVCHGNICRSPMAEFVMKDLLKKNKLEHAVHVESAATSLEEIGNTVYPPVKKLLYEKGISVEGKHARKLKADDYNQFDYIIGMDSANLRNMINLFEGDALNKCSLLMSLTGSDKEVADPWYTRDFQVTYDDIIVGCQSLLEKIKTELNS